jgi:cellulose synthase operon protein C
MIARNSFGICSATLLTTWLVMGCAVTPADNSLATLDRPATPVNTEAQTRASQRGDAKTAYYQYIRMAPKDDLARNRAIARLADLEMAAGYELISELDIDEGYQEDAVYRETIIRTISLLETALEEFPDAQGNDRRLYQLAKNYSELGNHEQSLASLRRLADQYDSSPLYAEAKFRLAEAAFSQGSYMSAELAYTAALFNTDDSSFHQRALFKRGWSRYRQSLFRPALEDFVNVIQVQRFGQADTLSEEDRVIYEEYFRSLALTMLNTPDQQVVHQVFEQTNFAKVFEAYHATSSIYLQQERYSDAAGQWQQFLDRAPESWDTVLAQARIVSLWQAGGFRQRAYDATAQLYARFTDTSQLAGDDHPLQAQARRSIREHLSVAARYAHGVYQNSKTVNDFHQAQRWYQRYLEHFGDHAQTDGIYLSYGDLLAEKGLTEQAFAQYERAAFDGELILNPDAAYAAVALLSEMTDPGHGSINQQQLNKYVRYSKAFVQLYPEDERSAVMALGASQTAFHHGDYKQAEALAELALPKANDSQREAAQFIVVQSQLNQENFIQAEASAENILSFSSLSASGRRNAENLLAMAIYQQAELAELNNDVETSIQHFQRIQQSAPKADIAPAGLYNAIALAMEHRRWEEAIPLIHRFQSSYYDHRYITDAERHLSRAYLESGQTDQAARQFEQLARTEADTEAQKISLWRAAELYEQEGDIERAINAYRRYAHSYPQPYPQNVEAMHKLTVLYTKTSDSERRQFWEQRIVQTDRNRPDEQKTDRTARVAAEAALSLARHHEESFNAIELKLPLDRSLERKRSSMQEAIRLYATASSYGFGEVSSEATHQIAHIYEAFARSLLESERPTNLTPQELVQYDILLEDRAFPFEDRAIEFYERNLARSREQGYNDWMALSRQRLEELFPVRYARKPRTGFYISALDQPSSETIEN